MMWRSAEFVTQSEMICSHKARPRVTNASNSRVSAAEDLHSGISAVELCSTF